MALDTGIVSIVYAEWPLCWGSEISLYAERHLCPLLIALIAGRVNVIYAESGK
jgi:hypothetical protein